MIILIVFCVVLELTLPSAFGTYRVVAANQLVTEKVNYPHQHPDQEDHNYMKPP
jgi:hypothetical protein